MDKILPIIAALSDLTAFSLEKCKCELDITMLVTIFVANSVTELLSGSVDVIVQMEYIVKSIDWRLWHDVVHKPEYMFIEYAGLVLKTGERYGTIITHHGNKDSVNIPTNVSTDYVGIHSHPALYDNKVSRGSMTPSPRDYSVCVPNKLQLLVSKRGVTVYGIYGDYDHIALVLFLDDIDNKRPRICPQNICYKVYTWRKIARLQRGGVKI